MSADDSIVKRALRMADPENRMETIGGTEFEAATDIREGMSVGSYGVTDEGDDDTFRSGTGGKRKTGRTQRRTRRNKRGGKRDGKRRSMKKTSRKSKRGSRRLKRRNH